MLIIFSYDDRDVGVFFACAWRSSFGVFSLQMTFDSPTKDKL